MSIGKVNFQVYADGDKRILVVENCKGEVLEAFNRILEAVCGLPENDVKTVPSVVPDGKKSEPPKIKSGTAVQSFGLTLSAPSPQTSSDRPENHFPDVILLSGDYAGMTPGEAVSKDGIRAVPALCESSRDMKPESVRKQMVECCKHLVSADLSARPAELNNADLLIDFFSVYRQLLGGKCLKMLYELGIDLDDAIRRGDTEMLSEAYNAVLTDLQDRTRE